jgi:hypothetical protein
MGSSCKAPECDHDREKLSWKCRVTLSVWTYKSIVTVHSATVTVQRKSDCAAQK